MLSYCKAIAFIPPFYSFHFLSTPSLRERMRRYFLLSGVEPFFRSYSLPHREGWGGSLSSVVTPSLTGRVGVGLWAGSLILILQLLDKNISQA